MGRPIPPVAKEKVLQWFPMAEGSGDVVGYSGGTRKGPTWVEDDKWMGGYALSGDGVDDYVETTNWGEFGTKLNEDFCISFTFVHQDDGDFGRHFSLRTNENEGTSGESQRVGVERRPTGLLWEVQSSDGPRIASEHLLSKYNDNKPHRLVLNKTSNRATGLEIWVDTIEDTHVNTQQDGFSSSEFLSFSDSVPFFATNDNSTIMTHMNLILDDVIVYGDSLTESEIQQDYLRQHWS